MVEMNGKALRNKKLTELKDKIKNNNLTKE